MRRVLCFDPWESLKTPAPALYPEWGEGLRHFPGLNLDAFRIDIGIAFAEHAEPPEIWLLAPEDKSPGDIAQFNGNLLAIFQESADSAPGITVVKWGTGRLAQLADALFLHLTYPDDADKARDFLLPLALRAYYEIDRLLSTSDDRANLQAISLLASDKQMSQLIEGIECGLIHAAGSVLHEKQHLDEKNSERRYFDVSKISCGISLKETEIAALSLGWLYSIRKDEQAIRDWLVETTRHFAGNWSAFQRQIEDWHGRELQEKNSYGPSQILAAQPTKLRDQFAEQLAKLDKDDGPFWTDDDLSNDIKQLMDREETRLYQAIQRRPTRTLFYVPMTLFTVLAALFIGPVAALTANPSYPPWTWLAFGSLGMLSASALILAALQIGKWKAFKQTSLALTMLQGKIKDAASRLRTKTVAQLTSMLIRRNLDIVAAELEERAVKKQKLDYHLRELGRHYQALNPLGHWQPSDGNDSQALPDLNLPVEQNRCYRWEGKLEENSLLIVGMTELPLASFDQQGRYAGLARIEFKTGKS